MTLQLQAKNQRNRILGVLLAARGAEVSLHEIAKLGIAQHGARLSELRAMGFRIVNRQEFQAGERLSWYRLANPTPTAQPKPEDFPANQSLFGELSPDRTYRE